MIKIFKTEDNKKLTKLSISEAVSGSWFSLINPTEEEIKQVSLVLGLDEDFLRNSLDLDERSRIEIEDGNILIITNLPIMTDDGCFDTLPLGIIYTPTSIITVCSKDNNILASFNETTAYTFDTRNKTEFMLKILYRSVKFYLKYLDIIWHIISLPHVENPYLKVNPEPIPFNTAPNITINNILFTLNWI